VSDESVGKAAVSGFGIFRRGKTDPFRGPWKQPALKTRLGLAVRAGRVYVTGQSENENGNPGAIAEYREVARLRPNDAQAYFGLGVNLGLKGGLGR
jgi:hypothetical protein